MKINQRLFDHYGIDTSKDLKIKKTCARPFDTLLIDKQGSCYACECTSWLPQSVGNLRLTELSEIMKSSMRRTLQESVSDGTYRYCNQRQCSYIRDEAIAHGTPESHIKNLRLAIDNSCNLRCPSCRKDMIFHKAGSAYDLGIQLADKINDWLHSYKHLIRVHIGSDGDPFASHIYRHFMTHTPKRDNIDYSILTNALMFQEFHIRVPHIVANLKTLGVSMDGSCKETYEKLRLGGKWDKILEGLECIRVVKNKYRFTFDLHMVVQQDNYREIEQMVELCRRYEVDRLYLNRIQNWQTGIDFRKQTFTSDPEFIKLISQLIKKYHKDSGDLYIHNNVLPRNTVI